MMLNCELTGKNDLARLQFNNVGTIVALISVFHNFELISRHINVESFFSDDVANATYHIQKVKNYLPK